MIGGPSPGKPGEPEEWVSLQFGQKKIGGADYPGLVLPQLFGGTRVGGSSGGPQFQLRASRLPTWEGNSQSACIRANFNLSYTVAGEPKDQRSRPKTAPAL